MMRVLDKLPEGRIVFLDIDGCLTTVEDGSSFLCMDDATYRISEKKAVMLLHLLYETDANVVISSNWRKFGDDGCWICGNLRFKNNLPHLRTILGDRYLGDLPYYRGEGLTKAETLEKWGESVGADFDTMNFVVIDDDLSEGFLDNPKFRSRYVHCISKTGMTSEQCDIAKRLFSER